MGIDGFAQLTNRVFLGPTETVVPDNALSIGGGNVPKWLHTQLEPINAASGFQC